MSLDQKDVVKALSVVQLAQVVTELVALIAHAVTNGQDGVTEDELAAAFAGKDSALAGLDVAIARAKAEGR